MEGSILLRTKTLAESGIYIQDTSIFHILTTQLLVVMAHRVALSCNIVFMTVT